MKIIAISYLSQAGNKATESGLWIRNYHVEWSRKLSVALYLKDHLCPPIEIILILSK